MTVSVMILKCLIDGGGELFFFGAVRNKYEVTTERKSFFVKIANIFQQSFINVSLCYNPCHKQKILPPISTKHFEGISEHNFWS